MIDVYTWPTPNGHKVHIMLQETGLPHTIHPVNIRTGEQFGAEFLRISPNNKIPAIVDSEGPDGKPISLMESGAILIYLASKAGRLMPKSDRGKFEMLEWLMFQMASVGPMMGQANHFRSNATPERVEYAINRYTREVKRLHGVMERRLGQADYLGGNEYTIADIAVWPWYGGLAKGLLYGAKEFLAVHEYKNVNRWADEIGARPAVKRGRIVNRLQGEPSQQLHERHDASDFELRTQDKLAAAKN